MRNNSKNGVYGTFSGEFKFFKTLDISDLHEEYHEMNANEKAWAKMLLNSSYKTYTGNGEFRFYDPEIAKKITEQTNDKNKEI